MYVDFGVTTDQALSSNKRSDYCFYGPRPLLPVKKNQCLKSLSECKLSCDGKGKRTPLILEENTSFLPYLVEFYVFYSNRSTRTRNETIQNLLTSWGNDTGGISCIPRTREIVKRIMYPWDLRLFPVLIIVVRTHVVVKYTPNRLT